MPGTRIQLTASSNKSCCVVKSSDPAPQYKASDFRGTLEPLTVRLRLHIETAAMQRPLMPPAAETSSSPPSLQPLLCTFLI